MTGLAQNLNPTRAIMSSAQTHQHEASTHQKLASRATCRSVKSIVAWLESSSTDQSRSPRGTITKISRNISTGSSSTYIELRKHKPSVSAADDVEEYSLTYLKYKNYFTCEPLGRCLDRGRSQKTGREDEDQPFSAKQDGSRRSRLQDNCDGDHATPAIGLEPALIQRDADEVRTF